MDISDRRALHELGETYAKEAVLHLKNAGIELIAPQGTREGKLTTITTAIGVLIKRALDADVHNIAVLFLGYRLAGVKDYGKAKGYNLFRKYIFQGGSCLTLNELIDQTGGIEHIGRFNKIIRQEMEKTVPPEYLEKHENQTPPMN